MFAKLNREKWIQLISSTNSLRDHLKNQYPNPNDVAAFLYLTYLDQANKGQGLNVMSTKTEKEIKRLSELPDNEFQKLIDEIKKREYN